MCSDDERTDTQLPLLVTASVDAIHLRQRLDLSKDIQVSGQVVWTGKSAMDIRMHCDLEAANDAVSAWYDLLQHLSRLLKRLSLACMFPAHNNHRVDLEIPSWLE